MEEKMNNSLLKPLKIGDYLVPVPVVQGGMGVGVSLSGLAGAVAACGGVGIRLGLGIRGSMLIPLGATFGR